LEELRELSSYLKEDLTRYYSYSKIKENTKLYENLVKINELSKICGENEKLTKAIIKFIFFAGEIIDEYEHYGRFESMDRDETINKLNNSFRELIKEIEKEEKRLLK